MTSSQPLARAKTARGSKPKPGQPVCDNDVHDQQDAVAIAAIVAGAHEVMERRDRKTEATRLVKLTVRNFWERPRLPEPFAYVHYPRSFPWSPAAQQHWKDEGGKRPKGGWGLEYEHLYPRRLIARDLLALPVPVDPEKVQRILQERCMGAVITKGEHSGDLAGFKNAPTAWSAYRKDPWIRYEMAGLHVAQFKPVG